MKIPDGRTELEYLHYLLGKVKKDYSRLLELNWELKFTLEDVVNRINQDNDRIGNLIPVIDKHFNGDAKKAKKMLEMIQNLSASRIVAANKQLSKVQKFHKKEWAYRKVQSNIKES